MTCTVAISGAVGAGKTSLAKAVMERFKGRVTRFLSIDDYDGSNHWYPGWLSLGGDRLYAVKKWRDAGCDPDSAVHTPELRDDLIAVKTQNELEYAFLEEPFGRLRKEIAPLIDISIHIEVPLDVALARATINQAQNGTDPVAYLERYLQSDLRALFETQSRAADKADYVVSGLNSVNDCANEVAEYIRSRT